MHIGMLYLQNDINIFNNCTISMRKLSFTFSCFPGLKFLVSENDSLGLLLLWIGAIDLVCPMGDVGVGRCLFKKRVWLVRVPGWGGGWGYCSRYCFKVDNRKRVFGWGVISCEWSNPSTSAAVGELRNDCQLATLVLSFWHHSSLIRIPHPEMV